LIVIFSTARAAHEWLRLSPEIPDAWRASLRALAYGYQLLALAMVLRWIHAQVPELDQVATFLFLGTALLVWNVRQPSAFGIRCSLVLTLVGLWIYLENLGDPSLATFLNGLAFLALLAQPAFLRRLTPPRISQIETWAVILLSAGAGLIFVSEWMTIRIGGAYLTMGWALYAVFLYVIGLLVAERRQQWCGIAVLLVAFVRVALVDMWGLSNVYKVLTFIVLTVVTLGLGFLVLRNADRAKKAP
jgi:hypothetical protein